MVCGVMGNGGISMLAVVLSFPLVACCHRVSRDGRCGLHVVHVRLGIF